MPGNARHLSLVLSGLGQGLICLFWLPGHLLRQGFRGAIRATVRAYSDGMAIERWKRGLLPVSSRSGGSYQRLLPSGRPLEVTIRLVGGRPGPAFLEVKVDGEQATLLFAERPGQTVPSEVTINGKVALHHTQAEEGLTRVLDPEDTSTAHRLVRWVALLLE